MILNILKANGMITELETEKKNLLTKLQESETEVNNLKNMSKDMTEAQALHNTAIANLKADYEKQITDLKASQVKQVETLQTAVVTESTSAGEKAKDIVASMGLPPETIKVESVVQDIKEQYLALQGTKRIEFFEKHKKEILKGNINSKIG